MKVLISGGGFGGLTVANFLHRQGHEAIIIDKAHQFSNAGFVLSLKSFGVEIMNEIGLEQKMRSFATKSDFVNFLKPKGELVRKMDFETINKNLSDSIMATRASLHNVLYDDLKAKVEIKFNSTIKTVEQSKKGVVVKLSDNSTINADLLIISEGIRSTTREMIWTDAKVEDFNIFYAAGRLEGKHSYQVGNYLTYRGVKKMIAILPLSENELAIQCYIHNTDNAENLQAVEKGLLSETFKHFDKEVLDLIKRLEVKGGIFSDKIGMVHTPILYKDNIVLLGDAGYCPTPLSGMGASLSIYGAKALAHFIDNSPDDLKKALDNYNSLMQPIIQKFQSNARNNAQTFLPLRQIKLWLMNLTFRLVPLSFITRKMNNELTLTYNQRSFIIED